MAGQVAPIAPRSIPITDDQGHLDERYMPDRLKPEALDLGVDLIVLFENGLK